MEKQGNSEEKMTRNMIEAIDVDELNEPDPDIQDALKTIQVRRKSTSVSSDRPILKGLELENRHVHNEDWKKKSKNTTSELL